MSKEFKRDILEGVRIEMAKDGDVGIHTQRIVDEMARLLDVCDIEKKEEGNERDDYTDQLVDKFVGFVACGKIPLGGSAADYCSMNALSGVEGYRLRLHDDEAANLILHEMRAEFHKRAWEPKRMFAEAKRAGIPIGRH